MQLDLRIAAYNSNGLSNHTHEVELLIKNNCIDILLVSEIHFTSSRTIFKIRNNNLIIANQPHNNAHIGSAILIKSLINYEVTNIISQPFLQAVCIKLICNFRSISICSVYFPSRFKVSCKEFQNFFDLLGPRFIVGGDFNSYL